MVNTADAVTLAFRLPREQRDRLLQIASVYDRTVSGEIRRALRFYLANVETVDRALRDEAATGS
jgi:predicted DNA-binding protein